VPMYGLDLLVGVFWQQDCLLLGLFFD
jgi:hypothetical protein